MDHFEQYEEEFLEIRTSVENSLSQLPTEATSKNRQMKIIQGDLQECEEALFNMKMAANQSPNASAKNYYGRLKEYENDIQKMKTKVRKAEVDVTYQSNRDTLMSGYKVDKHMQTSMDQRGQFIEMTERLHKTSDLLDNTIKEAENTKTLGIETLGKLDEQTDMLEKIKGGLSTMKDQLKDGNKLMRTIGRKAITNKLILSCIICVMLIGVVFILWLKFKDKF